MPTHRKRPQAIFVLGMHRSGTSATTRLLNLAGARLPDDMIPAASDNPRGFWESRTVVDVDDRLLAAFGASWREPFDLSEEQLDRPDVGALRDEARAFLRTELRAADTVLLKDPRMCRLMPFWLGVARDAGATPAAVLTLRDPTAVAASLRARNRMGKAMAHRLWTEHVLAAERATRGIPRYLVSFDALIRDPAGVAEGAAGALGIATAADGRWQRAARAHVDRDLVVHRRSATVLDRSSAEWRAANRVYESLLACADGRIPAATSDFLDAMARRRGAAAQPDRHPAPEDREIASALSPTR